MIAIREEIRAIEEGKSPKADNPLKHSPHTATVIAGEWNRPYSRTQAAFPMSDQKAFKFWPSVSRIDDTYGDSNLVCACPPMSDYE